MSARGIVVVRGGGDIATGTIYRLHRCGYRVLILETDSPTAIRRTVSFCEAIYDKATTIEDVTAVLIQTTDDCEKIWQQNKIAICVDRRAASINTIKPIAVVDAILAKKNFGTSTAMAPITIGLGPGFCAGRDVHAVIETARGHSLGRVIYSGKALPNSGIPGEIQGVSKERVIYAKNSGNLQIIRDIGSCVRAGEIIAKISDLPVQAPITGLVRGMLRNSFTVHKGLKIADIDPRIDERENCYTISDKARCISGSVLEALLSLSNTNHPRNL
jgi:xanthine dehydrogenase accessory factor